MSSIGLLLSLAMVIHDGLSIQPETASSQLDLYSSSTRVYNLYARTITPGRVPFLLREQKIFNRK